MKCSRLDDDIVRSTVQDTADGLCAGVINIFSDKGNTKALQTKCHDMGSLESQIILDFVLIQAWPIQLEL